MMLWGPCSTIWTQIRTVNWLLCTKIFWDCWRCRFNLLWRICKGPPETWCSAEEAGYSSFLSYIKRDKKCYRRFLKLYCCETSVISNMAHTIWDRERLDFKTWNTSVGFMNLHFNTNVDGGFFSFTGFFSAAVSTVIAALGINFEIAATTTCD